MDFLVTVLFLTNVLRDKPLKVSPMLNMEANIRAQMLCKSSFSHAGFEWYNPGFSHFGENLGRNYQKPIDVVFAWYKSPTHRANMLDKSYQFIGAGYASCTDGTNRIVEMFGN